MPMIWNAEADAKLLLGILKIYDVKISKSPKLEELNAFMGPDCVGLAITNRITRLKKSVEGDGNGTNGAATTTPKTPKSGKRKNGGDAQDGEESPTKKRGRTKNTAKDEMSKSSDEGGEAAEAPDMAVNQEASFFDAEE
ncbi:hypothetical protein DBV05_g9059 [Lasiodiplodia theobromae]|uniref:Uncharacterized protein n=1 Tax=Lasiodiplodia theobromae TaxID=45133 RepID=A0A5N5D3M3_9PEZI|nr:hypothetical protein DBV05_g9059 [Lasiodiplodia theobromae]